MIFPFLPYSYGNVAAMGGSPFDPAAAAFFSAAGITDGTQQSAVNSLVLALKAGSLWTPMNVLYPMVGGTSSTNSYNLVNPALNQITWSGGVTFDSNGVTGDGSSGFGDTGLDASTLSATSNALGTYQHNAISTGSFSASAYDGAVIFGLAPNNAGVANFYDVFVGADVTGAVANSQGLFTVSRTASNAVAGYRNSTSIGTNNGAATMPARTIKLLRFDNVGSFSAYTLSLVFVSTGLTSGQISALYTIIQNYQTALGRQV